MPKFHGLVYLFLTCHEVREGVTTSVFPVMQGIIGQILPKPLLGFHCER